MNIRTNNLVNKVIAIIVVMLLTMSDFLFVGASTVSYAINNAKTNSANVEFSTYFLNQAGEKVEKIEEDINKSFISYKDVDCVKFDVPFSGEYDFTVEMHMNGEDWEKTVPKGTLYNNEKKEIYVLSGHDRCKLDKGTYYLALQPDNHYYYHLIT